MPKPTQQPHLWRRNAAAIIVDADGLILLGKDPGRNSHWHFPQGGVERNEEMQQAVIREIQEEVGLRPDQYRIIKHVTGLRYEYPPTHSKVHRWIGQEQTYFLVLCHDSRPVTCVDHSPEFCTTKWFPLHEITPELFPKFKRGVVRKALKYFFNKKKLAVPIKKLESKQPIINMDTYLVTPGKKFKLKDCSPDDRSVFLGSKEEGLMRFSDLQAELAELQKRLYAQGKKKILIILQAMDAGGKDGCVRNVFSTLDPQGVHVVPFKKPSSLELAHDFLWRVHHRVPANGEIVIFNRSHYEDIIAVRVKKLFEDEVWKRRYRHVVDFEQMLSDEGTIVIKFFLNISKAEQKSRLESRLKDPQKLWKFLPDDLADRALWDEFQTAYQEVIEKTSTPSAPWHIVPANKKWYRNLVVAQILVDKLKTLDLQYPTIDFDPATVVIDD